MEEIGIKLQKAVLIMMSIVSMSGMSSCEDHLDSPRPSTGGGKAVEVSLCVGLADEEDAVGGTKTITVPDDPLPSPLDQYRTIQVSNVTNKGQYTCWAPAVVREESANATSDLSLIHI